MITDPYAVLGISPDATDEELKRTYRELSKRYHPDANPDDPEAAEEKFKDVQAAYRQIVEARERGTSAYGPGSQRTGYSQQQNAGSPYGRTSYTYAGDPFSAFEDFFTQWQSAQQQQQQQQYNYRQTGGRYNEILQRAISFMNAGRYQDAWIVLSQVAVSMRDAQWNYLAAIANQGLGNNVTALEFAQRAYDLEPSNYQYSRLVQQMRQGGVWYQNRGASYTPGGMTGGFCFPFFMMPFCCMFC